MFERLSALLGMPVEAPLVTKNVVLPMGRGAVSVIDGMQFLYDRMAERIDARDKGIKNIVDDVRGILPYAPVTIKAGIIAHAGPAHRRGELPAAGCAGECRDDARIYLGHGDLGRFWASCAASRRTITLPPDQYDADTDRIGAVGVEGQFEDVLRGQKGQRYIEEDVVGREVRVVGEVEPAVPGDNVYLTIDFDLQKFAYQALQDEIDKINADADRTVTRRGAAIAMNPEDGRNSGDGQPAQLR